MTLVETAEYLKIGREGKIPGVKIEHGRNNKVIIRIPYNQELIEKVKTISSHLLESGVDLRYIQEVLGHKSSKTTEIYTHVSKGYLESVRNPLDSLFEVQEKA
jgi:integrase